MASQSTYLAYVFTKTPHMNQRPSKSPVSYQDTLFSPGITFTFVPPHRRWGANTFRPEQYIWSKKWKSLFHLRPEQEKKHFLEKWKSESHFFTLQKKNFFPSGMTLSDFRWQGHHCVLMEIGICPEHICPAREGNFFCWSENDKVAH